MNETTHLVFGAGLIGGYLAGSFLSTGLNTTLLGREKIQQAMRNGLPKVAAVPGKIIPKIMSLPNWAFKIVAQRMLAIDPTARTSMWEDLSGGRSTELDFINGAVVDAARTLGIDCPVNNKVVKLVHRVERGEQSIGFSPEELQAKLFS